MYAYIIIDTLPAAADAVAAVVGSWPGVTGIEERPADDAPLFAVDPAFAVVEYGTPTARRFARWLRAESFRGRGSIQLRVYVEVPDAAGFARWRADLVRQQPQLRVVGQQLLPRRDYGASGRSRWRGRCVGRALWVGPPWQRAPRGRLAIVIEPGLAFGSGAHPTTRLCLAALERLAAERFPVRRVFDVGTGSGVLAIAAAKLFPRGELWLSDLDAACAENATGNLVRNGLARRRARAFWGPRARLALRRAPAARFDLVVTNIYLDALGGLVASVARLLRPGGRWLVSGLLAGDQEREFVARLARRFAVVRRTHASERRIAVEPRRGLAEVRQTWVGLDAIRAEFPSPGGVTVRAVVCAGGRGGSVTRSLTPQQYATLPGPRRTHSTGSGPAARATPPGEGRDDGQLDASRAPGEFRVFRGQHC